ncbi:hypothetical protein FQN53_003582 [Emmonsiellopsis sp. PD_33]|nr:hypothetical protein FQN53_003582 [Emmonsiellopsis sp. PD_33]
MGTNILLAALTLGLGFIIHGVVKLIRHRRFYRDLPKPPGHSFIFGHLKLFGEIVKKFPPNVHPQYYYTYLAHTYDLPDIFYVDLWPIGPAQMVMVGPDAVAQVTQVRNYDLHDEVDRFLTPIIGKNNIAATNGAQWKKLHHMIAPAFKPSHVKSMVAPIADETAKFHAELTRMAESGETFSMEETMAKLVFDIVGEVIFGFPVNAQTTGSAILKDLRTILDTTSAILAGGWNPITKARNVLKRNLAKGRSSKYIAEKVRERHAIMKEQELVLDRKQGLSILDLILVERMNDRSADGGSGGDELSPEFMEMAVNNLKGFLAGGHGTTTDTLCYIYMLLSAHPEVMQKLREEHDQVFGKDPTTAQSTLRESPYKTNELLYTTAVIKEVLRLFPIGFVVRKAKTGTMLDYNNTSYPAGDQQICLCQHAMHYNPSIFPNPTKFDPERFMDPTTVPRNAWRPFERGPRACMGQELAMDEMKCILLMTVRSFEFECLDFNPSGKQRVPFTDLDLWMGDMAFQNLAISATPSGKVMMKVRKRAV